MFLIYGLLTIAMIYGIIVLLKPKKTKGQLQQKEIKTDTPNIAGTNEGGNSQRAEQNAGGSKGQSDYNTNSMGADNDEDKLQAADGNRKQDYNRYES